MKNYFKKFNIMFVMLLAVLGVGTFQDGSVANAATVGELLTQKEVGWERFDDYDTDISYTGSWLSKSGEQWCNNTIHGQVSGYGDLTVKFNFIGTKLRIVGQIYNDFSQNIDVKIDGVVVTTFSQYGTLTNQVLNCEISNLTNKEHFVELYTNDNKGMTLDAIDIDSMGILKPYNENITNITSNISLNKYVDSITVGNSNQLTATTTPAGAEVNWTSSDPSIATVDSTGKVTAIKEGQVTITAQIKDSETKATCEVTVTNSGNTTPTNPTEPTTGDANLFIELVDGNIKSYNVSSTEVSKFKQWYLDRDNTKSNKPYYEFSKGEYKDYVIHDKIDWFEVR